MSIQLYDPTGVFGGQSMGGAPRPPRLDGLRLGLLSNKKLNADLLLRETAALFVARHGCVVAAEESKPRAGQMVQPAVLQSIIERADLLITATGD